MKVVRGASVYLKLASERAGVRTVSPSVPPLWQSWQLPPRLVRYEQAPTGGATPRQSIVTLPSAVFLSSHHSQPVAPSALKVPPRLARAITSRVVGSTCCVSLTMIVPTANSVLPGCGSLL